MWIRVVHVSKPGCMTLFNPRLKLDGSHAYRCTVIKPRYATTRAFTNFSLHETPACLGLSTTVQIKLGGRAKRHTSWFWLQITYNTYMYMYACKCTLYCSQIWVANITCVTAHACMYMCMLFVQASVYGVCMKICCVTCFSCIHVRVDQGEDGSH